MTILRGLKYIIALGVVSVVFSGYLMTKAVSLDRFTLNFVVAIELLFAFGFCISYLQQRLLDAESLSATARLQDDLAKKLKKHHGSSYFEAVEAYCDVYERQLKKYFLTIGALSSILITAGLIGTIVGLIVSMGGLKDTVASSGNSVEVLSSMTNVLAGVDISFYTTLVGSFFGGIILRLNLVIHEHCSSAVLAAAKLQWLDSSVDIREQTQSGALSPSSLQKELVLLRKLYTALSRGILETTTSLSSFQGTLQSLAEFPVHIQLQKVSEHLSESSKCLKNLTCKTPQS